MDFSPGSVYEFVGSYKSRLSPRCREPVNLVELLCSPVTYIAWDSTGVGGLPTRQHRRKRERGGEKRRGAAGD